MKITEINNIDEFKSLRSTWNDLIEKSCDRNIFLTWEWLFTWWKYFGNNKKLKILIIEDRNEIIAIFPFFCSTYGNFIINYDIVENIGQGLSDYGGIIFSDMDDNQIERMFVLLQSYIISNKLILRFDLVPNDSKFLNLMHNRSFAQDSLFIGQTNTTCSPYLPIQSSLDDHLNMLSKNFRKNLRRGERNIEKKIGNLEFKKLSTLNSLDENLDDFWRANQKKMIYQNLPCFNKTQIDFLTDVSKKFAHNSWLNLSFLDVNGQHVSSVLGFEYNKKYYWYQSAFDPNNSNSVGNIHILYILKDLIARDLKEFDFLRGDEAFKLRWHPLIRKNNRIVVMKKNCVSKYKYKTLNWMFLYNEIKKHNLLENYRLYAYKMKQINETKKIEFSKMQ